MLIHTSAMVYIHAWLSVNRVPASIPGSSILFIRHPTPADKDKLKMNFRICEVRIAIAAFQRPHWWASPYAWMVDDGDASVGKAGEVRQCTEIYIIIIASSLFFINISAINCL